MTPEQQEELTERAVAAMRAAVEAVVEDHRRQGKPLVVWRDGKVVREMPTRANADPETWSHVGTESREEDRGTR